MLPQDTAGVHQLCTNEKAAEEYPAVTLEIKLDLIPLGIEDGRRTLFKVKISQVEGQDRTDDFRNYDYEILEHNDMIPKGMAGSVLMIGRGQVLHHKRGDRALELVRRVLENHLLGI